MFNESKNRGAGRGGWAPRTGDRLEPRSDELAIPPLGGLLSTITYDELVPNSSFDARKARITSCEYLASYSWMNTNVPSIAIPGRPPVWSPPSEIVTLQPDSGDFFRDPNAARFPHFPTEPAVQAVLHQNPVWSSKDLDVFACGSTMGNLLNFARGKGKAFRFDVETIGNTVFFVRKEVSPTALIEDIRGFGHSFPEAYTTWDSDVKRSALHMRIVRYTFGGLNFAVRFGCDGYHKGLAPGCEPAKHNTAGSRSNIIEELDDIVLGVGVGNNRTSSDAQHTLTINIAGMPIPQEAVFDIKTKHRRYPIDMDEILPRLWVSQVPNFVLAYQERAMFADIRKQNVRADVARWEIDNNEALAKLVILIRKILTTAKTNGDSKFEVVKSEGGDLEIHMRIDNLSALPEAIQRRWIETALPQPLEQGGSTGAEDFEEQSDEEENDDIEPDFTACSADLCGYCGKCTY